MKTSRIVFLLSIALELDRHVATSLLKLIASHSLVRQATTITQGVHVPKFECMSVLWLASIVFIAFIVVECLGEKEDNDDDDNEGGGVGGEEV